MAKHEHNWKYDIAEYPEVIYILKMCLDLECDEKYEGNTLPPKWERVGKFGLRENA